MSIIFSENITTEVYYPSGKTSGGRARFLKAPFNLVRVAGVQYIEPVNMNGIEEVANTGLHARDYLAEITQLGRGGEYIDGFEYIPDSHGSGMTDDRFDQFALGWL